MSRIGKKSILIPDGVTVRVEGLNCTVSGPKGQLQIALHPLVEVSMDNGKFLTSVADMTDRTSRALWGTMRALVQNMITGVTAGYQKKLDIVGVGYRVAADAKHVILQLGYSHPIEIAIPPGIAVVVEKNSLIISGIDKQLVGQFAALIRGKRPPEPYKGKGVKYSDEIIRRKAGKVVKAVGG